MARPLKFLPVIFLIAMTLLHQAVAQPVTVAVDVQSPGAKISPLMLGLSYEAGLLLPDENGVRYFRPDNRPLVQMFRTLGVQSLRIGGNSVDATNFAIPSAADVRSLFQFAQAAGVKVIYSVRLQDGDPQSAAQLAKVIRDEFADTLDSFAIGNEPSYYKDYAVYTNKWLAIHDAMLAVFPYAKFSGPDQNPSPELCAKMVRDFGGEAGRLAEITQHSYSFGCSYKNYKEKDPAKLIPQDAAASREKMLAPDAYGIYEKILIGMTNAVAGTPVGFRLSEANSYWFSGLKGASDSYASALWGADYLHWWAAHGASGINFHTGDRTGGSIVLPCRYAAFVTAEDGYEARPLAYGLKLFKLGGYGKILPVNVAAATDQNLMAYATLVAGEIVLVTLINKTFADKTGTEVRLKLSLPSGLSSAKMIALNAKDDDIAAGPSDVNLGGARIKPDGTWGGRWQSLPIAGNSNNELSVTLPPASAAVIQLTISKKMNTQPILLAGEWRAAKSSSVFRAENPATGEKFAEEFPVSTWADCDASLNAAADAAKILRTLPAEQIAKFLNRFAERIEARKTELVETAHAETALPKSPRLGDVELPRTTNQLRQAAAAVLDGEWALSTIDAKLNIRSMLGPVGPVLCIGPNNFPFAYNGVAGGDFASAIGAGNPVIAKAHPCHPRTSQLLAEEAFAAVKETGLPTASVQMLYQMSPEDGLRMVADKRLGAAGFTGSRAAGMKLKAAADAVGKPIYLEMSSINPVLILPGALAERGEKIVEEFCGSCLMAAGQFCTSPGLVVLFAGGDTEKFIGGVKAKLEASAPATLLSSGVAQNLASGVKVLQAAGATIVTGGAPLAGNKFANTLLRVSGEIFLASPERLQTEAFGNASLVVVARDADEVGNILAHLEGNLTGSIYSDTSGGDDALYEKLSPSLRQRVGRLLNDKMPTGVAVTASMNHGGPFPATGHPGFTAVGFPAALRRFAMLQSYDNVRPHRLPAALRDKI